MSAHRGKNFPKTLGLSRNAKLPHIEAHAPLCGVDVPHGHLPISVLVEQANPTALHVHGLHVFRQLDFIRIHIKERALPDGLHR